MRRSQGDADLDPSAIATHAELLGHKPTQPTHSPPTSMPVRLEREKGHVPPTCVTRRLPTILRLPSVQYPKRDERARAKAPRLLPDSTELFVHSDITVATSEELGSER